MAETQSHSFTDNEQSVEFEFDQFWKCHKLFLMGGWGKNASS